MKISESSARCGKVRLRGKEFLRAAGCWMLVGQLAGLPMASAGGDKPASTPAAASAGNDPILKAMQNRLTAATTELVPIEQQPSYPNYTLSDQDFEGLVGAYRSL